MGQVGSKMRRVGPAQGYSNGGLAHWCPACEEMHAFATDGPNRNGAQWRWDGSVESPTFTPSMNITVNPQGHKYYDPESETTVCHYFLRGGVIEYLGDCTHHMRGQKVPLPELPERYGDK